MVEPLLRVQSVSKHFEDLTALEGVTFTLEAGEVLGLVGRPGAGRSTLLHLLAGLHLPSGGQIYFEGRSVTFSNPRQAQRLGIEMVHQRPQLLDNQDVAHNIFLGREIAGLVGLGLMSLDQMYRQAQHLLIDLDLPVSLISKRTASLSAEQRQMVAFARALCRPPRLILLDNALAVLSYQRQQTVLDRLKALAENGAAIVISSDDLRCLFAITDRILVLYEGRQVAHRYTAESVPGEIVDLIVGTDHEKQITPIVWALESYHATQKQTDELRRAQTALWESLEAQASLNLQLIERLRSQIRALDQMGAGSSQSTGEAQGRQTLYPVREAEAITLAHVLVAQGRLQPHGAYLQEALTLLDRLLQSAELNHRSRTMIEILVLQALAHQAGGHIDLAITALKRALTLAETGDYLKIFLDEGWPMVALLQTIKAGAEYSSAETPTPTSAAHPRHLTLVNKLLTNFRNMEGDQKKNDLSKSYLATSSVLPDKEPLSDREQAVLDLIAAGLSTQEIAEELSVSPNTVKSHTKNIYSKLNVRNRTQAIKLAKELNLI